MSTNKLNVGQKLVKSAVDASNADGSVWTNTGIFLMTHRDLILDIEIDGNAKAIQKGMQSAFGVVLTADAGNDVPIDGYTVGTAKKDPEFIKLRDEEGNVKWRSWDKTARMIQNLSTIFPAVVKHGVDKIFPEGVMLSKYKIDQLMAKDGSGEAPLTTIIRSLDMAIKVIDKLNDIAEIGAVEAKHREFVEKFNEVAIPIKQAIANDPGLKVVGE